jgi:bifunctional non-homologous end joining protein LigD
MSLTLYKKKRNFRNTPEPGAKNGNKKSSLSFVIQRHDASHLHYDFRLEMEGVLKSWAVPKGPSMKAGEKRLAVHVEDHPLEYGKFFGEIPEGNYGAGTVEIWDKGTYQPVEIEKGNTAEDTLLNQYKKGNLKFILHGKYLNGEFALVRMHGQDKNWLLIKKSDDYSAKKFNIEALKPINSFHKNGKIVSNGKTKKETDKHVEKTEEAWKHLQQPMLAKLSSGIQNNANWLYEMKYDGYRALTKISNGKAEMWSRNGNSFNKQFAPLVAELENTDAEIILDGEVVIENKKGISDFQLLQNYFTTQKGTLKYYVFDILFVNGHPINDLPLRQRKELLDIFFQNYKFKNIIRSDFVIGKGEELFKKLSAEGYEGIIAKDMESRYFPGKRIDSWLKIKNVMSQEVIICGYTLPQRSRKYFGSLILGVHENNKLKYIGNCGTGFTEASLKELHGQLKKLVIKTCPFETVPSLKGQKGKVVWLRPELVCHVKFHEWTNDQHLRAPVFMGLRIDKKATEVAIEKAENKTKSSTSSDADNEVMLIIDNKKIKCTNLNKIYFPDDGITKGDLINYYRRISSYILPYLKDRPLSLNRHPNGINGPSFFQKDMNVEQLPEWVETSKIYSKSNKKYIHYLICNDQATLVYIANLGSIEINPWHSKRNTPEMPDYLMLDLDPGEIPFQKIVDTALVIKDICDELSIRSYCKTSGARGLHIYIPLAAKYDYDLTKTFAELLANIAHKRLPDITSLERPLAKRKNKIYLDFLQNRMGQTIAAPYCVRPKPQATVSTPLLWNEVNHQLTPQMFTIHTMEQRLKLTGDLWKGVLGKGIDLNRSLHNIEKIN